MQYFSYRLKIGATNKKFNEIEAGTTEGEQPSDVSSFLSLLRRRVLFILLGCGARLVLLYLRMLRTYTWLDRHRQQRTNMFVSKTETVVGYLFANFLAHRGDFVDLLYNSSASGIEKCYWR